jgi:hypothetical protein
LSDIADGATLDGYLKATKNCELLNWFMPLPVNQHSIISGATVSATGYFLDGWKLISGSVVWTAGGRLAMASGAVVRQYLEKLHTYRIGKVYTFSIDTSDGIKSVTITLPASVSSSTVYTESSIVGYCTIRGGFEYRSGGVIIGGTTQYYVPYWEIAATESVEVIPWAESGGISTMANAGEPDFGVTLRDCQRFFEKSYNYNIAPGSASDVGYIEVFTPNASSTLYATAGVTFKAEKRMPPTVNLYSTTGATGKWRNISTLADVAASTGGVGTGRFYSFLSSPGVNTEYAFHWTASAEF